jgi:hypothetical protein
VIPSMADLESPPVGSWCCGVVGLRREKSPPKSEVAHGIAQNAVGWIAFIGISRRFKEQRGRTPHGDIDGMGFRWRRRCRKGI